MAGELQASMRNKRKAFTLLELTLTIVIMAIISIPVSLMISEFVRASVKMVETKNVCGIASKALDDTQKTQYSSLTYGTTSIPDVNYQVARTVTSLGAPLSSYARKITVDIARFFSLEKLFSVATYRADVTFGTAQTGRQWLSSFQDLFNDDSLDMTSWSTSGASVVESTFEPGAMKFVRLTKATLYTQPALNIGGNVDAKVDFSDALIPDSNRGLRDVQTTTVSLLYANETKGYKFKIEHWRVTDRTMMVMVYKVTGGIETPVTSGGGFNIGISQKNPVLVFRLRDGKAVFHIRHPSYQNTWWDMSSGINNTDAGVLKINGTTDVRGVKIDRYAA